MVRRTITYLGCKVVHHSWSKRLAGTVVSTMMAGAMAAACGRPGPSAGAIWPALSDTAFATLVAEFSEPERYFDTDNLISNEATYLGIVEALELHGVSGGAYIGVGPDQNFSYIASIRPQVAFIVDIRRDNLLQQLWFKALFQEASSRVEFLALMYGKPAPHHQESLREASIGELTAYVDTVPANSGNAADAIDRVRTVLDTGAVALSAADLATIRQIHERFIIAGLDLRFETHGRFPRACYPTHRYLLTNGGSSQPDSYLATDEAYQAVRRLQMQNLVIPVVGDLSGSHALSSIGGYLAERQTELSALYASNVEFYLFEDGVFDGFVRNVATIPHDSSSVVIRSIFPRGGSPLGKLAPGSCSWQSVQRISSLMSWAGGDYNRSYFGLIRFEPLAVE